MFDLSFLTLWTQVFMFYVIICHAPVAIVIQCFIDASDFSFFIDYKPLFIALIAVITDNPKLHPNFAVIIINSATHYCN